MIWFTSDHHFGHKNIIKFCNRPFDTIQEMDQVLIDNWNSVVSENDTTYYLGDFTLGNLDMFYNYIKDLNGNINIVPGGHDRRWLKNFHSAYWKGKEKIKILDPLYTLKVHNKETNTHDTIVLCHYPMLSWDKSHYGSIHLHGHSHGTIGSVGKSGDIQLPPNQRNGKRLDVGVDVHNYYPISLDTVKEILYE